MKLFSPGMIGFALSCLLHASFAIGQTPDHITSSGNHELYVFAIPIDYRSNKDSVEYPGNWDYIGKYSDHIPYCAPGQLQACQLVVDERDTDPSIKEPRKLKPTVKIIASFNCKDRVWYINNYIPTNCFPFIIRNEEAVAD